MTNKAIDAAQDYLTLVSNNRVQTIMNVKTLLERHPCETVVSVLQDLARQKQAVLMQLIEDDKTSSMINETVATMFRLHMAIQTIQDNLQYEQEVAA